LTTECSKKDKILTNFEIIAPIMSVFDEAPLRDHKYNLVIFMLGLDPIVATANKNKHSFSMDLCYQLAPG
jgi:hypothetical protein